MANERKKDQDRTLAEEEEWETVANRNAMKAAARHEAMEEIAEGAAQAEGAYQLQVTIANSLGLPTQSPQRVTRPAPPGAMQQTSIAQTLGVLKRVADDRGGSST